MKNTDEKYIVLVNGVVKREFKTAREASSYFALANYAVEGLPIRITLCKVIADG